MNKSFAHIENKEALQKLMNDIQSRKKHVFVLIHMEGCPACVQSRPHWLDLNKEQFPPQVQIADVEKSLLPSDNLLGPVQGYPTFRYFSPLGRTEDYENSSVLTKDRSPGSFKEWIHIKTTPVHVVSPPMLPKKTTQSPKQPPKKKPQKKQNKNTFKKGGKRKQKKTRGTRKTLGTRKTRGKNKKHCKR